MHCPSKIDLEIRDAFALTAWADNWARAREEASLPTHSCTHQELTEQCPPVPPEATYMATQYLARLCTANECYRPERLLLRAAIAQFELAVGPSEATAPGVASFVKDHADAFGSDMYMEAVGHGVAWSDDYAAFEHVTPEADFDELQILAAEEYLKIPLRHL